MLFMKYTNRASVQDQNDAWPSSEAAPRSHLRTDDPAWDMDRAGGLRLVSHLARHRYAPAPSYIYAKQLTSGLVFSVIGGQGKSPLGETQSLLSALSAGMLIYAACVEMLAADFVMDQTMWRSPMRRQVMALVAVAVGVTSMSMVG